MTARELVGALRAAGYPADAYTSEGATVTEWAATCPRCERPDVLVIGDGPDGVAVRCTFGGCPGARRRPEELRGLVLARAGLAAEPPTLRAERQPTAAPAGGSVSPFISLADVKEQPIKWWWPGRLAWGMAAGLAGDGGVGKSTLAHELAARMTRGQAPRAAWRASAAGWCS